MTVYILHFEQPYHHAQHYVGYAHNLEARLAQHRNGSGARLIQVINQAGIRWRLARTWEGDRSLERQLKARKNGPRLCPICMQYRLCERAKLQPLSLETPSTSLWETSP